MITRSCQTRTGGGLVLVLLIGASSLASAQQSTQPTASPDPSTEIHGLAMFDMGYQNEPVYYGVLRATQRSTFPAGSRHNELWFAGVRQTRFGVKSPAPASVADVKTIFESDLCGVGIDAGQTMLRLRNAWDEVGDCGVGQVASSFMDGSTLPNTIEYWGPIAMLHLRIVQVRYTPVRGDNEIVFGRTAPGQH